MELWMGLILVLLSKLLLLLFFKTDHKYVLLVGMLLGLFCFSLLIVSSELLPARSSLVLALVLLLLLEMAGYRLLLKGSWVRSAGAVLAAGTAAFGAIVMLFAVIK